MVNKNNNTKLIVFIFLLASSEAFAEWTGSVCTSYYAKYLGNEQHYLFRHTQNRSKNDKKAQEVKDGKAKDNKVEIFIGETETESLENAASFSGSVLRDLLELAFGFSPYSYITYGWRTHSYAKTYQMLLFLKSMHEELFWSYYQKTRSEKFDLKQMDLKELEKLKAYDIFISKTDLFSVLAEKYQVQPAEYSQFVQALLLEYAYSNTFCGKGDRFTPVRFESIQFDQLNIPFVANPRDVLLSK